MTHNTRLTKPRKPPLSPTLSPLNAHARMFSPVIKKKNKVFTLPPSTAPLILQTLIRWGNSCQDPFAKSTFAEPTGANRPVPRHSGRIPSRITSLSAISTVVSAAPRLGVESYRMFRQSVKEAPLAWEKTNCRVLRSYHLDYKCALSNHPWSFVKGLVHFAYDDTDTYDLPVTQ
jgi:hypothetical protein